ncbi:hypothetical protein E3N88_11980 [Mikania micrantha]|uniref:Integrase catalytic domain-containing protein n=1 Tax=Mikania micrantha TaxID=192012 RepID=A0A5N6P5Z7_9ASTR|nr:hypothetical protein E3N88_11980 [Mikania micrantha]
MAALNKHDTENGTLNKPPMFTPEDYDTWKVRMEGFIRNQDFKLWKSVLEGPFIPTVPAAGAGGAPVPKDPALYSDEDYKRMEVDSKALWLIQMAIPNSIIHAFKKCKSAQELWNSLQQMYEGSEDVKEIKKDMLKQKFENFYQQNNEKMTSQYLRYVQLVDELEAAGVKMEKQDVIRKFLRSLPQAWNIYSMEIDAHEPKPTHITSGSAALYAPINNSPYQSYQPIYHPTSTPNVTFPEIPTPSTTHTNPFSNPTPLLTSGQGAFMAEETNYFHLCKKDLDGILADDLEDMYIDYQMSMISYRAKNFQAKDASISNSALMANDSTSSFVVTDDICTPECLEKLNVFKRINSQLCNELESLQVVKANFFESERNYKEKIEEMEKTISSLKHEDTNKQCQIDNLLERLTTTKTELVLAESYRDKFLSQGEKYEKLFKMSNAAELVKKIGAGLGYNRVEPPSTYTPMVEIRCKPVAKLVYDDELDIHKVAQNDDLSDLNPSNSTCSDEDDTPINLETEKPALKIKKRNKKTKKHSSVFVKVKNIQTGSTSLDDYVTCPSDKSKRGRSKERRASFSGKQTVCLMCGEKNHFAADCFYNPRRRMFSETQGRGRKKSWSKSSVSLEELGRNLAKKASEASTSDSRKKQNQRASEKMASEGKRISEAHAKKSSYKPKKAYSFGRRTSEGKTKTASDDCQKHKKFLQSLKHMTGNKTHLHKYEPFFGGSVAFGSDPVGGYITGRGTITNGKVCDQKNNMLFTEHECIVMKPGFVVPNDQILLRAPRRSNMYILDMSATAPLSNISCFVSKASLDESSLWHRRLCHVNLKNMNKLVKNNLVTGLPTKEFICVDKCVACLNGKQHKTSHHAKEINSITTVLHLLHMDLFGPTSVKSLGRKSYCLVVTDDFFRYTWVFFLSTKDETAETLKSFILRVENESITRQFSVPSTPQQNGVAERRNMTLIEAARTMLSDAKLPITFWAEAVNTACYVQNRVLVVKTHGMTPYEIWHKRKPFIGFFKPFGCQCTILNAKDHLAKFAEKSAEGYFVGYSSHAKAYRVYIEASRIIKESANVQFNEHTINKPGTGPDCTIDSSKSTREDNFRVELLIASRQILAESTSAHNDVSQYETVNTSHAVPLSDSTSVPVSQEESESPSAETNTLGPSSPKESDPTTVQSQRPQDLPEIQLEVVLPNLESRNLEPKKVTEGLKDNSWVEAIQEELLQFERQGVWKICPLPKGKYAIGTKWVFRNKKDDKGVVIKNMARLVVQGYTQEKGIDYDEVFAPVARIEAIRIFLAFAAAKNFKVFQMDVKSAFLYGRIDEEVCVRQPPGFEDPKFPDHVCKLDKALYGLHQAPRKCSMGELTFFLGLQVKQTSTGIFISQSKYVKDILERFKLTDCKALVDEDYVIEANMLGQVFRVTKADIQRVLQFGGESEGMTLIPERCIKGCFLRIRYFGVYSEYSIKKGKLPLQYKLLAHVLLHCLSMRKGTFDELRDLMRSAMMLIDEWFPEQNLPRVAADILKLKHMADSSLGQVKIYQKSNDDILTKDVVGHCARANYVAPLNDGWRHEDSSLDNELLSDNDDDQQPPPPPPRSQANVGVDAEDEESTESEMETVQVGNKMLVSLRLQGQRRERMAKMPKKKKTKTPRIIVSSPVSVSSTPASIHVSEPVSVATTVQEAVSTSPVHMSSDSFFQSHDFVNVATFVPSFMDATTVTTTFQATSTSRGESLFEGLDDLDLKFSLDYDDSEIRRRISILSQEFDKYRKQKEKAYAEQTIFFRDEDIIEKKLMNEKITSLEKLIVKQSADIDDLKKENKDLKQKIDGLQVKDTQAEATSADPVFVNLDDEEEEEKVDYEESDVDEHPSFNAYHGDDEDDDGDMTGVGSSSVLNSISGAIVIYKPYGISFDVTPISSDKAKDIEDVDIEDLTDLKYPKESVDCSLPTFMDLFKQHADIHLEMMFGGLFEEKELEEGEIGVFPQKLFTLQNAPQAINNHIKQAPQRSR